MNKRILTLFLSLTLLLSLAACGGNADTTDARRDANEIVVGIAQDLENSLDPYTSVTAANREVLFNVFEGLVKPDADGNLIPAVAERWEVSDDQLTYTFHLRPGVKFHDGSEVTAMDVAWSIDKAMQSGNWKALDNIDAIDIGSDYVSVVLKAADSDFLSYMTLAITPEDHADGADPVGTGPFKFIPAPRSRILCWSASPITGARARRWTRSPIRFMRMPRRSSWRSRAARWTSAPT